MTRTAFLFVASTVFASLASASTMTDRLEATTAITDDMTISKVFTPGMSFMDAMSMVAMISVPDLEMDRASPDTTPKRSSTTFIPEARAQDLAAKAAQRDATYRPKR